MDAGFRTGNTTVKGDRGYDFYRPAYRYGSESANRFRGRDWKDVEPEIRSGWDRYEHRGENNSTWDEIKDAARDARDRVTGNEHETHRTSTRSERF